MALADVAPLSLPMIRVEYTSFLVPVRLAPVAFAWNVYCRAAVGLICAFKLTPLITPAKKKAVRLLREGARRDRAVVATVPVGGSEKVPTWSVTRSRWGWIAGAVLLKVNWE